MVCEGCWKDEDDYTCPPKEPLAVEMFAAIGFGVCVSVLTILIAAFAVWILRFAATH